MHFFPLIRLVPNYSPMCTVWQCKLVSGWGLRKRRSVLPSGPCRLWKTSHSVCVCPDDITEANRLMTDLEPTTPQEYILKGVVNAVLGQEQGIVCYLFSFLLLTYITCYIDCCTM